MKNPYKEYELERYAGAKSRFACPSCGRSGEFTRYVHTRSGEYISSEVGVCNRINKCGYSFSAFEYFKQKSPENSVKNWDKTGVKNAQKFTRKNAQKVAEITSISLDKIERYLSADLYEKNNFLLFLKSRFGRERAIEVAEKYFIGTLEVWNSWNDSTPGGTLFLQIDGQGRIRQANKMLYDARTGKRVKDKDANGQEKYSRFCGKEILALPTKEDSSLTQCLFGEHLIRDAGRKIAVVESAKTAIICSIYFPDYTWIATNTQSQISLLGKCEELRGRDITLFADLKSSESKNDWKYKVADLRGVGINAKISDFLESVATEEEKRKGSDLADYLLECRVEDFLESGK